PRERSGNRICLALQCSQVKRRYHWPGVNVRMLLGPRSNYINGRGGTGLKVTLLIRRDVAGRQGFLKGFLAKAQREIWVFLCAFASLREKTTIFFLAPQTQSFRSPSDRPAGALTSAAAASKSSSFDPSQTPSETAAETHPHGPYSPARPRASRSSPHCQALTSPPRNTRATLPRCLSSLLRGRRRSCDCTHAVTSRGDEALPAAADYRQLADQKSDLSTPVPSAFR